MDKEKINNRIEQIEKDRKFYEEKGVDVDALIEAEKKLYSPSPLTQ